jgi:hypothetical protein
MRSFLLSCLVAVTLIGTTSAQEYIDSGIISDPRFPVELRYSNPPPNQFTHTTDRFGNPLSAFRLIGETWIGGPFQTQDASFSIWCLNVTDFKAGVDYAVNPGSDIDFNYQLISYGTSANLGANVITNDSLWHQLVLTLHDSSASIYVDGNLASSSVINSGGGTGGGWFRWDFLPNPSADGAIDDDITILNTSLSPSEVSSLYTLQSAPEPSTYALFGIGAIGLLMVMRRKKTA